MVANPKQQIYGDDDIFGELVDQTDTLVRIFERPVVPFRELTKSITRPADTTAYTANDAFANSTSAPEPGGFQFTVLPARYPTAYELADHTNGFIIRSGIVVASAVTAYSGEMWLFGQSVTAINDNAAFTITDAEALTVLGVIPFNTSITTSANAISYVTAIDIPFTCRPADLRFLVRISNAPTPASAEVLSFRLQYEPRRPF